MTTRFQGFGSLGQGKVIGGDPDPDPGVVTLSPAQRAAVGAFIQGPYPTCTGTLITPRVVLSAGHCTTVVRGTPFVLGDDAARPTAKAIVLAVARRPEADVMLAYLSRDMPVEPLALGGPPVVDGIVQTVGYGRTTADASGNTQRWWLVEPIRTVGPDEFAVYGQGEHGLCLGDSGGPALMMQGGDPVVVGTLSQGEQDCTGTDLFKRTDVSAGWVQGIIEGWEASPPKPYRRISGTAWFLGIVGVGALIGWVAFSGAREER